MKKIAISLFAAFMAFSISAQETFTADDMVLNAGVGFGWYSYGYGATSFPVLSLSLEKGIRELDFGTLSVGGIVGFKRASYGLYSGYDDLSWTDFIVAARGALHVNLLEVDKLDTYGGVALGLRFETYKHYDVVGIFPNYTYDKVTTSTAHPLFALYVGGRYYFTDNIAAFGELGYGLGYLTLGVSLKL